MKLEQSSVSVKSTGHILAVKEALSDGVRVLLGISIAVMSPVVSGPPSRTALDGSGSSRCEENLKGECGLIRGMGPETMVASGDTQTGEVVIGGCEDACLGLKRYPIRCNKPHKRYENNEVRVQPVDMLVPVLQCDRLVGDIWIAR